MKIGYVQDTLTAFQAVLQKRGQDGAMFILRGVQLTEVIAGAQLLDRKGGGRGLCASHNRGRKHGTSCSTVANLDQHRC
jgi:hypothetical protein